MENKNFRLNTFNLILGIIGMSVTVITSIGGSYVTVKVTQATQEVKIYNLERKVTKLEKSVGKQTELLHNINTAVSVIEERTK